MKNKRLQNVISVFIGALLLGLLWRVRGTNGWGSSWGLLNAGFVFTLFLIIVTERKKGPSLTLISLTSLSFMLTVPAWGTLLNQITGILSVKSVDNSYNYDINPFSAVILMLCLGFGLASVYGILLGRCFGSKKWQIKDYAVLLAVFIITDLISKASLSHVLLRLIEPQACTAFADGLKSAGITDGVYKAYMSHFSAVSWAKKIFGGRNYFSSVGTLSLAVSAVTSLLAARFIIKDKFAAKTGAAVCGAFAFSITVSDLFFFFSNGGYRMAQGFSLPSNFAAWSLWEYFTGFIAGGIITAVIIKTGGTGDTEEAVLNRFPEKARDVFYFIISVICGIGLNAVRPILVRLDSNTVVSVCSAVGITALIIISAVIYKRKNRIPIEKSDLCLLAPVLCLIFTVYIFLVYMFIGRPEISGIGQLHNILVTISFAAVSAFCAFRLKKRTAVSKG